MTQQEMDKIAEEMHQQAKELERLRRHECEPANAERQYDGYGIYLCTTCYLCHDAKMSQYRPDIQDHYECDEPIEPEDY